MPTIRISIIATVFAFFAMLSSAAYSGPNEFHRHINNQHLPMMKKELSLTDDQVARIKKIYEDAASADKDMHADFEHLKDQFISTQPDSSNYDVLAEKLAKKAASRIEAGVRQMADARKKVFAVLTSDQQKMFMQKKAEMMTMPAPMYESRSPHARTIRGPR
ncbi:Uncharacterised protein [BD1-7 clade bacterium]|uniref:Periplasmic protein CpxP n=1 Tax=BD1-7 clade bacterium TaxID=2029982 RepID=A0A5S9QKI0_9GAMM|nr:Uncharacterised protein [BD1-7 clade bacterium]CAA0120824.1 Uncharacterised protein [BD1-7 clade bacterium]